MIRAHPDQLVGTDTEAKGQSVPASKTWLDSKEVAEERCLVKVLDGSGDYQHSYCPGPCSPQGSR